MKKAIRNLITAAVTTATMAVTAFTAFAASAADYTGEWYAEYQGVVLKMTISEDGSYVMDFGTEPQEGTWEQTDDGIMLDGEAAGVITDEGLEVTDEEMSYVFGRDAIEGFVPAEIDYEASLDALQGRWAAYKLGTDGVYMNVTPEDMYYLEMSITDKTVVMDGLLFSDTAYELENQDGGLSGFFDSEDNLFQIIAVNYLEDGTLRLALVSADEESGEMEYFFMPAEAVESATEAATE